MSDKQDNARTGWFRKGNRTVIAIAVGGALAVGGAFGVRALADSKAYSRMQLHGSGGAQTARFAELSDAEIEAGLSEWPNMLRLKSM